MRVSLAFRRIRLPICASLTVTTALATASPHSSAAGRDAHREAELETVAITATRIETPLSDIPATVSVISSAAIEKQLASNIKDLIRFEPGVSVRSSPARFTAAGASTGRDGHSGFNIRGLEGNRVLLQVDGVRVADAYSFGAQSLGRGDYVDLDILQSVEIVRGPSSALYGSDGLAGSVSFITKDPADLLPMDRAWLLKARGGYASSDNSRSESVIAAGEAGRWQSLVSYTRRDGEGLETHGNNSGDGANRTTPNPEDNGSNALLAKVVFAANDANHLRLTLDHYDRSAEWDVRSAISATTASLAARDDTKRDRVSLDHRFESAAGFVRTAHTTVYHQESQTTQFSAEDRTIAADRTRDSRFDNAVSGATIELTSEINGSNLRQRFVYGADYSQTLQEGLRNGTVPPVGESFPTHAFPDTDYRLAGAFLQDEITTGNGKLSLYPAVRWDHFELSPKSDPLFIAAPPADQSDSHVSPKLGALLRLTERVNLFANAAAGFKAPAPSQVNNGFVNPIMNYRSVSNPDLKPETSRSFEAGARVHGGTWSGSVSAFTGRYRDFIEQVQIGGTFAPNDPAVYSYVNFSRVSIRGVEGKANVELGAGFTFNAAASYARGVANIPGEDESALASIEPIKIVSGLEWAAPGRHYGAELFALHSQGKGPSRSGVACSPSCFLPEGFTALDVLGWWKLTDALELHAAVFNLTDRKYWWWGDVRGLANTSSIDAYSQPGRNVSVSISMEF